MKAVKAVYAKVEDEDEMACVKIPLTEGVFQKRKSALDFLEKNPDAIEISFKAEGVAWFPESFAASVAGGSGSIVFRRRIIFLSAKKRHNNNPITTVIFDIGSEARCPDRQIWVDLLDEDASRAEITRMLVKAGEM